MMNFNEFANEVVEVLKTKYYSQENYDVTLEEVHKNNVDKLAVVIAAKQRGAIVVPMIYMEGFYEMYKDGTSCESLVEEIVSIYESNKIPESVADCAQLFSSFDTCKSLLTLCLVNESSEHYYNDCIVRDHVMGKVIVMLRLEDFLRDGAASTRVTKELLNKWNVSEEEVYAIAQKNCVDNCKCEGIIVCASGLLEDDGTMDLSDMGEGMLYYFCDGNRHTYGASAVLVPGVLEKVYERVGTPFFVLPCSVHKLLVVSETLNMDVDDLYLMVREVNHDICEENPEDVLSYKVFFYDGKELTVA